MMIRGPSDCIKVPYRAFPISWEYWKGFLKKKKKNPHLKKSPCDLNIFQMIMNSQPSVTATANTQLNIFHPSHGHMDLSTIYSAC